MNIIHINSLGEVHVKRNGTWDYLAGSVDVSDNPTQEEIDRRFAQQLSLGGLSPSDIETVQKVWACQEINDARCRLYYATEIGASVETEFAAFADEAEFWADLNELAERHDLHIEEMFEGDQDGRIERQVALQKHLQDFDLDRVRAEKFKLEVLTQSLWDKQGVGVL